MGAVDYHSDTDYISKSGLDLIRKAPAKYYDRYLNPESKKEDRKKHLVFGGAFHSLVLEPENFKDEYFVMPNYSGDGSLKAKKEMILNNAGKDFVTINDYSEMSKMKESLLAHPIASKLISVGFAEKRFNWIDPDTGVKCKIKPDFYNTDLSYAVDLKTTEDASVNGFSRSAFKHRYHVQSPFYYDGLVQNGINPKAFIFIAIEKEPPYLVNVMFYSMDDMSVGRNIYKEDLRIYNECINTGVWPGYEEIIHPMSLPHWAYD